jgi:hypothetical protein
VDWLYRDLLENHTKGNPIQQELQRSLLQQMMVELRDHLSTNKKHGNEQSLLRALPRPLGLHQRDFHELHLPCIAPIAVRSKLL